MTTIAERIKHIRTHHSLTQREVAEMTNVSTPAVSQWERGLANPDVNVCLLLEQTLGINTRWLIQGIGVWKNTEQSGLEAKNADIEIPFFKDVAFAAGHGTNLDDLNTSADTLTFKQWWLEEKGYDKDGLIVVCARGDSMQPRIRDGDALLVKTGESSIIDGAVYVLNYANNARVKRLWLKYDGSLLMCSDNPDPQYKDELIPASDADQLNVIGRVVWLGGDI